MTTYGEAIRDGFQYLLKNYPNVFCIGQGLWSPWYVGSSMTALEKEFGVDRIIDTPVSELGCTGAAVGAALCGYRPIIIHPRVDFMLLAVDQIVNQAAKWCHMFGGQVGVPVTIRVVINRGGEQGAQHSQALHSWFAHIPGLRVVMPSTPADARDLLIASVLCDDPVLYIDDRWLYETEDELQPVTERDLRRETPQLRQRGEDLTLVGCSFSSYLCQKAADKLRSEGVECDLLDLRVINPLESSVILDSVSRTGRLLVVDGDWSSCGLSSEIIARVAEAVPASQLIARPIRITLPDSPAPTSRALEEIYYPTVDLIVEKALALVASKARSAV
jgi:pyruvate dehydrogenase E1 component beta subunit